MRPRTKAAFAAAVALSTPLVLATTAMAGAASAPAAAAAVAEPFGPGCADLKADAQAMAQQRVADAAAGSTDLTTVVTAIQKADLADTLNQSEDITVFAPVNDAFKKIPAQQLQQTLNDDARLKKVLTYHVVPQTLTQDNLAGSHKTLEGTSITVKGSGQNWTVNGTAKVICGNIPTANATVYLIDTVLQPK